jgi:hypothetical protein
LALFLPIYKIVELLYLLVIKELTAIFALHEMALFCIKRSICRTFFTIVERISPGPAVLYPLSRRAAPVAAGWPILTKVAIFHKSSLLRVLGKIHRFGAFDLLLTSALPSSPRLRRTSRLPSSDFIIRDTRLAIRVPLGMAKPIRQQRYTKNGQKNKQNFRNTFRPL